MSKEMHVCVSPWWTSLVLCCLSSIWSSLCLFAAVPHCSSSRAE